eukprot:TRINITY_DN9162_c0_g2_i1.p1 TRINITY_DN9162_c0_g2~~TRINITY_DN9162_c0_g2_i1.p1  ORF type:complete len:612 (+),score=166.70 TRINITY_DN9162_c0_g2_i1:57-1892(+)
MFGPPPPLDRKNGARAAAAGASAARGAAGERRVQGDSVPISRRPTLGGAVAARARQDTADYGKDAGEPRRTPHAGTGEAPRLDGSERSVPSSRGDGSPLGLAAATSQVDLQDVPVNDLEVKLTGLKVLADSRMQAYEAHAAQEARLQEGMKTSSQKRWSSFGMYKSLGGEVERSGSPRRKAAAVALAGRRQRQGSAASTTSSLTTGDIQRPRISSGGSADGDASSPGSPKSGKSAGNEEDTELVAAFKNAVDAGLELARRNRMLEQKLAALSGHGDGCADEASGSETGEQRGVAALESMLVASQLEVSRVRQELVDAQLETNRCQQELVRLREEKVSLGSDVEEALQYCRSATWMTSFPQRLHEMEAVVMELVSHLQQQKQQQQLQAHAVPCAVHVHPPKVVRQPQLMVQPPPIMTGHSTPAFLPRSGASTPAIGEYRRSRSVHLPVARHSHGSLGACAARSGAAASSAVASNAAASGAVESGAVASGGAVATGGAGGLPSPPSSPPVPDVRVARPNPQPRGLGSIGSSAGGSAAASRVPHPQPRQVSWEPKGPLVPPRADEEMWAALRYNEETVQVPPPPQAAAGSRAVPLARAWRGREGAPLVTPPLEA